MAQERFEAERQRHAAAARRLRWEEVCPARFRGAALDGVDNVAVRGDLATWAAEAAAGGAANLVLVGPTGRGKTHAALAACREPFMAGRSVLFAPVVELLDALRPEGGMSTEPYCEADVLVLDDLGGERATGWTAERLYLIVNRRWMERRPTVVTTNLEPAELTEAVGERTYDRLRDGAVMLRVGGERSRRKAR